MNGETVKRELRERREWVIERIDNMNVGDDCERVSRILTDYVDYSTKLILKLITELEENNGTER